MHLLDSGGHWKGEEAPATNSDFNEIKKCVFLHTYMCRVRFPVAVIDTAVIPIKQLGL